MLQQNLFRESVEELPIPGLKYISEFIDNAAEKELIAKIDNQPWSMELKRRVQHYGFKYDYKARNVSTNLNLGPLPNWLQVYCDKLKKDMIFADVPDQVIVNEYQPGQGISPHIDCISCFGETIASLGLNSLCVMDFANENTGKVSLLLEPRSLLILSKDSRYHWKHSIALRKADNVNGAIIQRIRRISLTFRNVIT